MALRSSLLFWSLIFVAVCGAARASTESAPSPSGQAVQPASAPRADRPSPHSALWPQGIGSGLRKGARQAGLALGPGFGTRALGSKNRHDLALSAFQYSRVMSDVIGEGRWYRGNAELAFELFGGTQYEPSERKVFGIVPLLRYTFAPGGRWVPFVNGGVGAAYTDISNPDINGGLQFTVQVGAGAHYFTSEHRALTLQYRWFHLSNGGLRRPNSGVNTHLLFAGMSWFF